MFIVGEKKVWSLKNDLSITTPIAIASTLPEEKRGIMFFGLLLFQNNREAVVQTQGKLFKTSFADNKVSEHEISIAYIMGGLRYNNFIITHGADELIFLDATTFKELKTPAM